MCFVRFSELLLFLYAVFNDSFYDGGTVYRAVQTESSHTIKLNLVCKFSDICHNPDLQTQNLNRMLNFMVCCMSPAVQFLLPYLLHFPLTYLFPGQARTAWGSSEQWILYFPMMIIMIIIIIIMQ
jgi:hypothetical protein